MHVLLLLLGLLIASPALPSWAQGFDLPGLSNDAEGYERTLTRRFPAGATPSQRTAAEQRAAQAERAANWPAAAQGWEDRIAGGEARPQHWLALARAQLQKAPPDAARALQAAWQNFQLVPGGAPEIPALLLMADALQRLDRPAQQQQALASIIERAPNDPRFRQMLAEARRAAGLLVARINTEAEAEPARACVGFTVPPARRTDWQPQDWVRAEPAVPGLAVVREGDALCVAGLPYGQTTRLVLRAGLPGEDGLRLMRDTIVPVAMPNRTPRIIFDSSAFLLPRGQAPRVGVATINLSGLTLKVVRLTERVLVPFGRDWQPGQALDGYGADDLSENWGRVVWEGRADFSGFEANRLQRHALPLPDALRTAGPGLYALVAKPADGARGRTVALPVMVTDLGLTAWRSAQGLAVQARGLSAGQPEAGVRVRLLATNNDILAEVDTGADGLARFAAPLLRGTGPVAPKALHASRADDLVALDLEAASFDLSDRGAAGMPHPGPLDAFVWLDRGIYRPGETVRAAALLRDGGGAPADLPARFRVRRPNGSVFAEAVPVREAGGAILWPIPLASGAPSGVWTLEVLADPAAPPIGRAEFRVDAFVPERLEVKAGPPPGPLVPGTALPLPVSARFLYGAPGEGLTGTAELRLQAVRSPFEGYKDFLFGLADEEFAPDLLSFEIDPLDVQGNGTVALALPRAPDTTRPLRAEVSVSIDEPGGRASRTALTLPVRTPNHLIGVRPLFADLAIDADAEAAFDIVALDGDGAPLAARLRARLVRERPDWRIVTRGSTARYETVFRDEPVDAADLSVAASTSTRFTRRLPFGRYRLEVAEPGTLAITSIRFRSGWAGAETAEVPDKVDVAADRRAYAPGDTARIRIASPFAGPASLAVLTDRLVALRDIQVAEGGTEVEMPVDAAWGPGAYLAVTVFRPGETRQGHPGRALGLAWLQLDPAARRIGIAFGTPPRIAPRQRLEVPLRLAGAGDNAHLTLAAVDEGILRLTRFATPDPVGHFTGQRRLGVDIRDDYGRLIPPTDAVAAALRQGGDEFSAGSIEIPQRTVALYAGPVAVAADGTATVTLDIPDFAGELRLMAVAWSGLGIGAASQPLTVRDAVVAEALLPRFLAPGDEARLPVLLHNLDLPAGEVVATLTAGGAIALAGPARLAATLAPGARALPTTTLRAVSTGEGILRLAVTGPEGFAATREARITVRSSRPVTTEVAGSELLAGQSRALAPPTERFLPNTRRASASFGQAVRYDAAGMLRMLDDYPFACLEQSASQLLAFSAAPADGAAGADRAGRLQRAAEAVLGKQRYDGAFGLWSAQGEAEPWLGPYAIEALLRARAAGAAIPDSALEEALKHLQEVADSEYRGDSPEERASQAYRLHVLSLAGRHRLGSARRLLERLDDVPTPLARAQLGAAFARAGDRPRAEAAFAAALAPGARAPWAYDYGNASRDALATAALLKESGLLPAPLATLQGRLPGPELTPAGTNTQEQAWAVLAGAALGRDGRPVRVSIDGRAETPAAVVSVALTGPASVQNTSDAAVWQSVSVTGIPAQPAPAGRGGMRIARRFLDLAGQPLNLDTLRQNAVFVLLLEGRAETREAHRAMLQQGLPAGFEIIGRLGAGEVPGMPWLGTLTGTVASPALDDRFAAALDLTPDAQEFRLAVRLRAVTAGRFELPGAEVADMYRPQVFARQNAGRIMVLGPDDPAPAALAPGAPAVRPGGPAR